VPDLDQDFHLSADLDPDPDLDLDPDLDPDLELYTDPGFANEKLSFSISFHSEVVYLLFQKKISVLDTYSPNTYPVILLNKNRDPDHDSLFEKITI
jgi:hypothetical protein